MNGTLIAGPCVIERDGSWLVDFAKDLVDTHLPAYTPFILKASFDKANRTERTSFRSIGFEKALHALYLARQHFTVLTDIHEPQQAARVAEVVDILQIPQALCRQLDLLTAAGVTGKAVNVKVGVGVGISKMLAILDTLKTAGAQDVWFTYRGTAFGDELVFDVARLHKLSAFTTTFADITHSTQTFDNVITGGRRGLAAVYAKAAYGIGCKNLFAEVHPNPDQALSDRATQLTPRQLAIILRDLC